MRHSKPELCGGSQGSGKNAASGPEYAIGKPRRSATDPFLRSRPTAYGKPIASDDSKSIFHDERQKISSSGHVVTAGQHI